MIILAYHINNYYGLIKIISLLYIDHSAEHDHRYFLSNISSTLLSRVPDLNKNQRNKNYRRRKTLLKYILQFYADNDPSQNVY